MGINQILLPGYVPRRRAGAGLPRLAQPREVLRPVTLSVHGYAVRMEREAGYGFGLAAVNAG